MFVKSAYIPVIKGKTNDIKALAKVAASISYGIKALVEITPTNPSKENTEKHVTKFVDLLVKHKKDIGDVFVDFYGLL